MDRAKAIACLTLLSVTTGCGSKTEIVVGSKNFTESVLLGEILARQIERRLNIPVDRKLNLGGTLLAHQALVSGSIDVLPEYTGTALTAVLKERPNNNPAAVRAAVANGYRQWKLTWLQPLGFDNTFAMVVRSSDAPLQTMSNAAAAKAWRLGAGYEFLERADGLAGLRAAYNLRLQGDPVTMDLGLLYSALTGGKVDMVAASATDGLLSVLDVRVLDDDKRYFPPYECAVVARDEPLARIPGLRAALEQLSGRLDAKAMQRLNYEVDGKHRPVREVAEEFLNTLKF
jgi:glycine betaine/choline ABC-type transport system substrate-binding protein